MKKIAIVIVMMVATFPAFSSTMCTVNDSVAIVLDPSINGTSGGTFDGSAGIWSATFSYGTIYGIAACLSSKYDQSMGGAIENLTDGGNLVVGGERNGQYCWCKMTHPAASRWVFAYSYSSASVCAALCVRGCGDAWTASALRGGLFGSVAQ